MASTTFPLIRRRTFLAATLGAAVASGTAACGFGDDEPDADLTDEPDEDPDETGEPAAGPQVLTMSMLPVAQLDQHIANPGSASGNVLQAGLMEGLVSSDPDGTIIPAVAESWTLSDDQLVYTFILRPDARWSNGDPVVADDVVWNWERFTSPDLERPGNPTYQHARVGVVGAGAYLLGEIDNFDEVGVTALDEKTVEFTLEFLNPDFLSYMAQWQTMLLHPATVKEFGPDWQLPENWVGNGPFILDTWQPNSMAVLVPNDQYWDADNYHITRWEVRFTDAGDSAEMVSYSADEIDVFRVEGDLAAIMTDPAQAAELASGPANQWRVLQLMSSEHEALRDIRVRHALSLAIDREALAELTIPDLPGSSLVPNGVPGYDQVPQTGFDLDQALDLLADAGYPDAEGLPTIQLLTPFPVAWMEAVGGMWEENLGVQSAIDLVEIGVYREKRLAAHPADYAGFSYGNFGVNPPTMFRAATMSVAQPLGDFMMPASALQQIRDLEADESLDPADRAAQIQAIRADNTDPEWLTYLDLAGQAAAELDEAARAELAIQTAIAREESYVAIPVLWGGYNVMVKPHVQNLEVQAFPKLFRLNGVEISA